MSGVPAQANATPALHRQLGLFDAVAIYIGIIIGSGVFFAPSSVAAAAPNLAGALGLWLLGGVVTACGALCYAEAGARLPHDGGFYVFYREVFGEDLAFLGGFVAVGITYPVSIAVMALILAEYLGRIVPALAPYPSLCAAVGVIVAAASSAVGVREGAWVQRLLTGTKVLAIAAVCLAAVIAGAPAATTPLPAQPTSFAALIAAVVGIFWTYSGWSDVTLISGELRDPGRNLRRAVVLGTAVLVLLHGLVQVAVQLLLPGGAAAASSAVVADAVGAAFGPQASRLVAALVVLSTFGAFAGTTLVMSRLTWAMGKDRALPAGLAAIQPRLGTPVRALVAGLCVTLMYLSYSDFRGLLSLFTFSVWFFYALSTVALLGLRRRGVGEPLGWSAGRVAPAVVIVTSVFMTGSLLWDPSQRQQALIGASSMLLAFVGYRLWRRLRRSPRSAS